MRKIIVVCEYLGYEFAKFHDHFEHTLLQELNFRQEVVNCGKTHFNFLEFEGLYCPKNYERISSVRANIQEFVEGDRIDDLEAIERNFGNVLPITDLLVQIYAKMLFQYGHIHCDADPSNILVRKNPLNPSQPQIVLIDHGVYCKTADLFRKPFNNLWYAAATEN